MPSIQGKKDNKPSEEPSSIVADGKQSAAAAAAEDGGLSFPFFGLLRYADALDWLLMVSGTVGSFVHGMGPSMSYYILGKTLDVVGSNMGDNEATVHELTKVLSFFFRTTLLD
jgi:ATP-binding cassette, subfamily B (MDR/TAP), member 1